MPQDQPPDRNDRVRRHTSRRVNERLDREAEERVHVGGTQPCTLLTARIETLEREWDIERALEVTASTLALSGLLLGVTTHRRWLWLSGGVAAFLLQHAVQGWCPPVPILRRMGLRTRKEIDLERYALKALRGDFNAITHAPDTTARIRAALDAVHGAHTGDGGGT